MEIEFARTFLAVAAAGNFVGAAQRLYITQSTVSARIQTLEKQLGTTLFRRGRSGAELTPAGRRFLRHAKTLVQTMEQAKHDVGLPAGFRGSLTLSGRIALWDGFLPQWVGRMRETYPDISLRLEIGFEEGIMQGLVQGTVDVGVMYTPESRPGLGVERLFEEVLVLVASDPSRAWPDPGYIHMDWGSEFHSQFTTSFPEMAPPAITANIGWLVMQQILHCGGSGYFPMRITRDLIEQGQLWLVPHCPSFSLPAYMVFPVDRQEEVLLNALNSLRALSLEERTASKKSLRTTSIKV
ncbi:LysR family transcriptional regulator [Sulfurirhabdus autotrophica]|uniref:DNA-binding transcriptional LysR family regulator n=2 Tax=Sulfurirhabdus autotrophica TaxID=1706046 RepID=A0A4R3YEP7_9PROT|nr:LysR family transcriptional regulator [Sulfurirhabdus autotrophica]TCV90647.1 DNA-binding transcriptional LysR family regulator [Sulfurirhabdus autotrophica]